MSPPGRDTNTLVLLRTKLHRPRLSEDLVPRPRLRERLCANLHRSDGFCRELTLISAPAGYGKTTLLCQWLEACPHHSAWLSLDEGDNDLAVFLRYLVEAIRTVFAAACPRTLELLRAPQLPPVDYLTAVLINEMVELPKPPSQKDAAAQGLILALDDYHKVGDGTVHDLLAALTQCLPPHVHLAIATRADPPLSLVHLRAGRRMLEVRAEELRFTPKEVRVYLERAVGLGVSEETIATLEERTEGWAVGLRLAALSLHGARDRDLFVRAFKEGAHRHVMGYLLNEVLAHQSPATQEFLLQTSILDRFCAPLCDDVLDVAQTPISSQAIIEELDRTNVFLVPLDYEGVWYRYHHLFRELLSRRLLARCSKEQIVALHGRASAWLVQEGLVDEAMHHALAAGDGTAAARLVEQHRWQALNHRQWRQLERWLDRLPAEVVEQRPALLLLRAWLLHTQFRLMDIPPLLDRVETLLDSDECDLEEHALALLRGEIDALESQNWYWRGEGQRCLELARRSLAATSSDQRQTRGLALLYVVGGLQQTGDITAAWAMLRDSLKENQAGANALAPRLLIAQMGMEFLDGDLGSVARTAVYLQDMVQKQWRSVSPVWGHYYLGRVQLEQNNLAEAQDHFAAALERRHIVHSRIVQDSFYGMALAHQALGQSSEAEQAADAASAYALETGNTAFIFEAESFRARLALLQGRLGLADQWARAFNRETHMIPALFLEAPHSTLAKVLLAQGTPDHLHQAETMLTRLQQSVAGTTPWPMIELLALQALLCDAQGNRREALAALEQAIALARPGRFIRVFVELGPRMAVLLRQLADQGVASEFVEQVLAAFSDLRSTIDGSRSADVNIETLIEPLTRREMEVLALLADRLTNKEIAQRLVISPLTVRKHASNIYQKLGVPGRREAVAAAEVLGILKRR